MPSLSRRVFPLNRLSDLQLINLQAEIVSYQERPALRLIQLDMASEQESVAILQNSDFKNGVIATEIAGTPRPDAFAEARGFVGIAFRTGTNGDSFEYFFIRPSNGRADDQLRRNHATQYCSYPDYPWFRLRQESPGVYESYTDLVVGRWTKIKIVVTGNRAQLYVNGADQPCLIVNDLKLGDIQGRIALWVGAGTEAHFSELILTPSD
jgi:hypothetical protein